MAKYKAAGLALAFGVILTGVGSAQAATIYLCRAYNGSTFWASAHCNQYNALIERIENVADGIPWDQQVQQAQQGSTAGGRQQPQINTAEVQRDIRCMQLIAERNRIESRYTNWQWQPPEVINPDQQRMRAIRSELSHNRCVTQ
ncbi:hypothetical protein [Variovorax soli]|uniref:DUF4124 domain-containing protein n=1 Tax=Variovorax soli TaxID=376815 RepID=A0ABU1NEU0_9BURK|nr:hypothetical protein [Variovorax soli]MDR6536975.1 hypothetical protein [Variovorax soli]